MSASYAQGEYERRSEILREDAESEGERRISQYLTENGIRYAHEAVPQRNRRLFGGVFEKPDFYLPDYDIYLEYWVSVHGSRDQEQKMRRKMAAYTRHRIRFISLFPEDMGRIGLIFRARFRETAGFELPHAVQGVDIRFCSICGTPPEAGEKYCAKCGRMLV